MNNLHFDPKTHTYSADGVVLPSVTQIIRFTNVDVAENARSWLRDAAARRGTLVHEYCSLIDYDEYPTEPEPETVPYLQAYLAFLTDYAPEWTMIERQFGSASLGYAGTIDRVGLIDGHLSLVDIKTSAQLRTAPLTAQLTGYLNGVQLELGIFPQKLYGLQLRKDGTYRLKEYQSDMKLWDACFYLHKITDTKRRK